jgi:exopolysaccharide production protein ExoQ
MPARNASPDRVFAAVFRNLLLYGFLFHLFASQAASLFSGVSDSDADSSSDAGSLYNQVVLPAMFLTVCILVYAYRIRVRVLLAAIIPMGPLLLVIALSTAWSEYPELTIRRASHELVEATTLALLAACFSNANVMLAIFFRAFLILGCLDLLSSAIFPGSFTELGFAGIHGHKNLAGQFFFEALPVYLMGTLYKVISGNRLLGLFSLVSGAAMLVLTQSKTSVGATLVGFSLVLLTRGLSRRNLTFRVPLVLFCFLGLLCAIAAIISWGPDELLEMLVGDPTLTGRDQIWRYAATKFDGSPIVGVGYGAIWQVGPTIQLALQEMGLLVFNEAHNGYLEIAAQLGIVGILCLLIFLIATLLNALSYWATIEKHTFCGAGALTIYFFWGLALYNITESFYFQAGIGSSGTLIFLGAFVASRNKRSMTMSTANGALPNPELVV